MTWVNYVQHVLELRLSTVNGNYIFSHVNHHWTWNTLPQGQQKMMLLKLPVCFKDVIVYYAHYIVKTFLTAVSQMHYINKCYLLT